MSQQEEVRVTINAIYEAAGINFKYRGGITEDTAKVVGQILTYVRNCSATFNWVPRPTGGVPSISWIAKNLGSAFARELRKKNVSFICARARLLQFRATLEISGI